jgi:TM2 domain-containing membrane protein YozV
MFARRYLQGKIMKNKWVAALLAWFFGWIGIHKFYLGNNVAGLLYFLFSWTFIPAILGIFDFIGLILTPEEAFNRKYNWSMLPQSSGDSQTMLSSDRITQALFDLKKLYEQGVITAEEYEEKRKKLLNKL